MVRDVRAAAPVADAGYGAGRGRSPPSRGHTAGGADGWPACAALPHVSFGPAAAVNCGGPAAPQMDARDGDSLRVYDDAVCLVPMTLCKIDRQDKCKFHIRVSCH